ncbi:MAG: protein kinase domain-containing protein [Gammaproteobacteria bacterium]
MLQERVEELFAALAECRPEERRARLAVSGGVDTDVRAEVESLLAVAPKARGFLSIAPVQLPETFEPETLMGQHLGPYRIVGELGDGGMSTVFLGERADGQYRQQVAIKLFRYHQGAKSLRSRFDIERHILATLEHPNIARLLDGGTCADGRPYLVMEYVRGVAIDTYCRARRLSLAAILELFCTVCNAVQYAHQNLVVHRDLKPGNILVTEEGVPKLLDFGIAKLLAPLPMGTEAPVTLAGHVLMTPEFAAPEQVGDAPITTATDVYALGVILYNLLTGQRPYEVGGDLATIIRTIRETEAPVPSSVVQGLLRAQLRGDLDNIVLRALRKEPEHRYPLVRQLAEDVERYRTGRAVSATKPTWRYRCVKLIKRNRLGVTLSCLSLVTLLAGTVTTTWQWRTAQWERERAERRFTELRALANTIVFELPGAIEKLPGSTEVRKRLLDQGVAYLDSLAQERRHDPKLLRELGDAYYKLATVQGNPMRPNVGDSTGALASYHKSLAIREALLARLPTDGQIAAEVGETYMFLSAVHGFAAETDQARDFAERCIDLLEPRFSKGQGIVADRLIECYSVGAHWDNARGAHGSAHRRLHRALALYHTVRGARPGSRRLGRIYEELAAALAGSGDAVGALRYERKRLALAVAEEGDGLGSRRLADAYHGLAARLTAAGRRTEALETYDHALRLWQARAQADRNDASPPQALAGLYAELAGLHLAMAGTNAAPEVQTEHRRQACAYVQESRTHLKRLPNPALQFGARYPWSASTAETLQRTAEHCKAPGMTPHALVATQGQP